MNESVIKKERAELLDAAQSLFDAYRAHYGKCPFEVRYIVDVCKSDNRENEESAMRVLDRCSQILTRYDSSHVIKEIGVVIDACTTILDHHFQV